MTSTLTLALRARNASRIKRRYQICLIHPFDPRGEKVGGLETYIRDFITFHPADTDILFIGVDSTGDLELGRLHRLTFRGRAFDFLPILHYSDQQAREAARTIRTSLTGQFFMALLRHFGPIARLIRARRCSIDLAAGRIFVAAGDPPAAVRADASRRGRAETADGFAAAEIRLRS